MFTAVDKALVALFGAVAFIGKSMLGVDLGISDETFGMIIAAAMPLLVYFVPNKPWTEK